MRRTNFRASARVLLGGLAAALGIGSVAAEAVTVSAEPASSDHVDMVEPASLPAPGTFESCTAMFGLYKQNSDLATFDVVETGTPLTPVPVVGTDIIPIVTLTDSSNVTQTCEAIPGWSDEATFLSDYVSSDAWWFNGSLTYPGTGYYLLPTIDGATLQIHGTTPFTPVSRTVTYANALPSGYTLTASPVQPVALQSQFLPILSTPSVADLSTPFFTRVFDAVQSTGSTAQRDFLYSELTVAYGGGGSSVCDEIEPIFVALAATMNTLRLSANYTVAICGDLSSGALNIGRLELFDAQVAQAGVTLTIAGAAPTTTTTAPAEPVTPTFTG